MSENITPRVLHIGKFLPPVPGGMEAYLGDLLRGSMSHGLEVGAVIHGKKGYPDPSSSDFGGAKVYTVPAYGQILYVPMAPSFIFALRSAIRDFRPNVLHVHMPNVAALWTLLIAELRRLPIVVHWHADVEFRAIPAWGRVALPIYRLFEKALLRKAHRIIVTSRPYLESSSPLRGFREKSVVLPLFVDPSRLTATPPNNSSSDVESLDRPLRILAVGRLTYYKGFDVLLKAIATVNQVTLTLIGEGEEYHRLKMLSAALRLGCRVRFLGVATREELIARYAEADVVCLPSIDRSEAFGLALLEAGIFGVQGVVSNINGSGLPWLASQLEGAIVAPSDPVALAAEIHSMADKRPTMKDRAIISARALSLTKNWMENNINQLTEVYRECLSTPAQNA